MLKVYASYIQRLRQEGISISSGVKKSKDVIDREYLILEDIVTTDFREVLKSSGINFTNNKTYLSEKSSEEVASQVAKLWEEGEKDSSPNR